MARGRIITNEITKDKRINDLSSDTSRLAFTWLVTFADVEGRVYGDPALLRSMLFPRRQDVTAEMMETMIREWHACGLIVWYEADGDKYIYFPAFEKNQPNLRKEREAASIIPPPTGVTPATTDNTLRSNSGVSPDQLPVKLREVNLREVNSRAEKPPHAPAGRKTGETRQTDLEYYKLQDHFLEFSGLPKPVPKSDAEWKEFNTLWLSPGRSILEWVDGDQNKAAIIVEEAVTAMQKDNLTVCNFKSIVKVASDKFSKRNGRH